MTGTKFQCGLEVLNLVISGIPSILKIPNSIHGFGFRVLNLILTGIPSILF